MATEEFGTANEANGAAEDVAPVPLLEEIRRRGRVWEELCEEYGVDNPDPPWKINLEGTYIALDLCRAFPWLERRNAEDLVTEARYQDLPAPERQVLALAHSMLQRGLLDEGELKRKMEELEKRLNRV